MSKLRWDTFHGMRHAKTNIMKNKFESTYSLLVRTEEKGRGMLEILVYAAFFLSVVLSILQFAGTSLQLPAPAADPYIACRCVTTQLHAES
jgi:hypothetical protein